MAYTALRRAILGGALAGGTRLVQSSLARDLELSTTPVREALRDLATEGLIDLDPHRGAVVRSLTREDLREVFSLRLLLEPHAMALAARHRDQRDLRLAEASHRAMLAEVDTSRWINLNLEFHEVLTEASRSPRLIGMLGQLRNAAAGHLSIVLRARENPFSAGNNDHGELLAAVSVGDEETAREAAIRHLSAALSRLENDAVRRG